MIEDVLLEGIRIGDVAPINTCLAAFVLYNAYESFYLAPHPGRLPATSDEYIEFMQRLIREGIARRADAD